MTRFFAESLHSGFNIIRDCVYIVLYVIANNLRRPQFFSREKYCALSKCMNPDEYIINCVLHFLFYFYKYNFNVLHPFLLLWEIGIFGFFSLFTKSINFEFCFCSSYSILLPEGIITVLTLLVLSYNHLILSIPYQFYRWI